MKILGLALACALTVTMPVNAQEMVNFQAVSAGDVTGEAQSQESQEATSETASEANGQAATEAATATNEVTGKTATEGTIENVEIPNVTGMTEEEAVTTLEAVVLPEGMEMEIIKTYEYSEEVPLDEVYEQTPIGKVAVEEAGTVYLSISMGQEPEEVLAVASAEVNKMNSFGIAAYMEPVEHSSSSMLGIDWDSLPCSYEYNWDNSANCWYWGMWVDGKCYKTPVGEYDTNVRHKMQLYCDGTNVYLHIVFATAYWDDVNGNDYQFYIDNQMTAFQLEYENGRNVTGSTERLDVGTHQVKVVHRHPWLSSNTVDGALAYLTKYEDNVNAEIEVMIPLSQMEYQNSDIDIENMGTIEFYTPNLMYRRITASGASTFPLATAGAAFVLIPGSTVLLKKYGKKKKNVKESDE